MLEARYGPESQERIRAWFAEESLTYAPPAEVVSNTRLALELGEGAREEGLHRAYHDRVMDANDKPYAFAHGYINGTKWRDMMSYQEGCGGCPRIPYWSNPRVMYLGEPTGTAASDNARVILEQAERVSKFR